MSKKKTPVAAAALTPKKIPAPRKPKAKVSAVDSKMKKTILSAPQALQLEAANSFMRTKAFTLQNKVRTAMTGINKIDKTESKTPSARLGLNIDASMQPSSQDPFLSKPTHRLKIAFLGLVAAAAIAGYFYSDRVMDGFKSLGDAATHVTEEKTWVNGMLTQTNGIPQGNDKSGTLMAPHVKEETIVPANDEAPAAAKATDVIPTETSTAAAAPKVTAEPKAVKTSAKAAKKGKATKAKTAKAKAKAKAKVAHK